MERALTTRQRILRQIATLSFIGYLPLAPGTWGSLAGLILLALLQPSPIIHGLLIIAIMITGTIASQEAEQVIGQKDSSNIIIDEVAGYTVSLFLLPLTWPFLLASFLLFRFFDILKPLPIKAIERKFTGGIGIMADDFIAGLFTNILLQCWIFFRGH